MLQIVFGLYCDYQMSETIKRNIKQYQFTLIRNYLLPFYFLYYPKKKNKFMYNLWRKFYELTQNEYFFFVTMKE